MILVNSCKADLAAYCTCADPIMICTGKLSIA